MKAAIFIGSRNWLNRLVVKTVFDELQPDVVIEGGSDGLETMAKWEALEREIKVFTIEPSWEQMTKLKEFEKEGYEISVQAFPKPGGMRTQGMMSLAEKANILLVVHHCTKTSHLMGRCVSYARKDEIANRRRALSEGA